MFSIIKDKLQSVQDNLTSSFRGLKITEPSASSNIARKLPVDLNAGADLLQKYQADWHELHMMAEENALAAQKVDVRVSLVHNETRRQWQAVTQLNSVLTSLPQLSAKTDDIISQIENIQDLIATVEETLMELVDTMEKKELLERQQESRYQLAIHGEKRLAQLDNLRGRLSEEHRKKVILYEKEFEMKQKERQETFGKAFEEDLQAYKETGKIPIIRPPMTSGPSLEDVELDVDTEALDRMLEE